MKRVVCFISPSLWRGDIKHTTSFINNDNSEKYRYFMKKVCILRKFRTKIIALKRHALCDVIMLLLMTSLAKERETALKSVM